MAVLPHLAQAQYHRDQSHWGPDSVCFTPKAKGTVLKKKKRKKEEGQPQKERVLYLHESLV